MYTLPPWVQEGGIDATLERLRDPATRERLREWFAAPLKSPLESVRISYVADPKWRQYEGRTLLEAVGGRPGEAVDPMVLGEFVCNILVASEMAVGCVVPHRQRGEKDVIGLMQHPMMMGGSDGIYTGSRPHPRGCGCYARYLGHYVRERVWTLETAVQRLSAAVAQRFSLHDRGVIRVGNAADVVVLDAAAIRDEATFEDGRRLATGVEHVLVNGELVLHAGERTRALPGRGLRRG
jgi:N-acyl-D-amino-acid deacylase